MVDQSAEVRGVAAAFLTLSSLAVLLRCFVRLRIVKAFGWDDFIMIVAMLFYAMFCGCMIGGSLWGTGKHLSELTPKQQSVAMEYWFLCDVAYIVSSILAKISICIFLLRIMVIPCYAAALYTVTGFTLITGIVFFVLLVAQCSPVSFWWTRMVGDTDGECRFLRVIAIFLYIFSAASIIFDLTVGLLPIILVTKLQMGWRTKAAVASLLGMACIASIAIIIRIPYVSTIYDPDFLHATVEIAIWSAVEVGLSITAGSLATTRPLIRLFSSPPSTPLSKPPSTHTKSTPKPNPTSGHRRFNPLSFDSGLGFGHGHNHRPRTRTNSIATSRATSHRRGPSIETVGTIGTDKQTSNRQSLNFYEPYLGVQMMTLGSSCQIEGNCADEFGSALPYPAAGHELLSMNSHDVAAATGRVGTEASVVHVPVPVPERAARSGSVIGVHRTFELSSEEVGEEERDGSAV
ncbi:hypothetical protein BJY04DRAFT_216141 [Aspergillus karnatakaensis]|uniref:uncharacterized protein n=1 Tax=Aspergillus karnatakaensis TaxID=1810916 RepID=UPI003CCDE409